MDALIIHIVHFYTSVQCVSVLYGAMRRNAFVTVSDTTFMAKHLWALHRVVY